VPVTDLDRQPERGQRRDPAQTTQPSYHRGELTVSGHRRDRLIETVTAVHTSDHRVERRVEGQLQPGRIEVLSPQPQLMLSRPRLPTRVDDPLPQQQFGDPMPHRHQIAATILPRTDRIPRGFLGHAGNRHRHDLTQMQQPR
jgi:hypothetical protein